MNELVVANNHMKTQLALPRPSGSQGMDEVPIYELRDELTSERNSKLKTWADYETKMWQYARDLREKESRIKDGKAMIDELRGELVDAQNELKRKPSPATLRARVLPETMSFSAGKRCMDHGYSFVWPSGKDPKITSRTSVWINPRLKETV